MCQKTQCTFCDPLPEAVRAKAEGHSHVPGYYGTDPDGHSWFYVSTRYAGTFGENLQLIHEPDEVKADAAH